MPAYTQTTSRQCLRYHLNMLDNETNEYLLESAIGAMGRIGTKEDIPLLEKYKTCRVRNVRECVDSAINSIEKRT